MGRKSRFSPEVRERLRRAPLEQLWRDHQLVGSMRLNRALGFDNGTFVVIYPAENALVASAVDAHRACLADGASFTTWTLEQVVVAAEAAGAGSWTAEVRERYLGPVTGVTGVTGSCQDLPAGRAACSSL